MAKFLVYVERDDGTEPVGTTGVFLIKDLKTAKGAANRVKRFKSIGWAKEQGKTLVVKSYTDIFSERTFKEVHREVLSVANDGR